MQHKYLKLFLLLGLIIIFLCSVFGCISLNIPDTKNPTEKSPIYVLTVETDPNQRTELGDRLDVFSETHNLEIDTAFYTNRKFKGDFFYVTYGRDLEISGYFSPDSKTTDIGFYEKILGNPPQQEYLDEIYNDLKTFLSEIPGVTIIEEK